jgi:hypothetical protein
MKKLLLLLLVVLAGCGGGSEPAATLYAQPIGNLNSTVVLTNNFKFARLDYRYDSPSNSFNAAGLQTTSYQATALMIDQIKSIGFNGIIFQLQVPINAKTGEINDDPTNIKTPPKALWQLIDYAKSLGLQVWISLSIVDSISDCFLTPDFSKYSEDQMFINVVNFDKPIAILAQHHKVDGIYISEGNHNIDSEAHLYYWKYLITQIKSVYTGKLSYSTSMISDTPIWNYVDYPSIVLSDTLSSSPVSDLSSIVKLYYNDMYGHNEIKMLQNIYHKYGKKIILSVASTGSDIGVGFIPPNFFEPMFTNFILAETPKQVGYTELKSLKVKAFLEIVGLALSDVTIGVSFTEFSPWLQNKDFSNPSNPVYQYYCCGWEISNDITVQNTLNTYFSQPWGFHTIKLPL